MLPQFYLDYLKTYFPDSEFLTLQILVWLLQIHRQVRIERLASSFPYPIKLLARSFAEETSAGSLVRAEEKKYNDF